MPNAGRVKLLIMNITNIVSACALLLCAGLGIMGINYIITSKDQIIEGVATRVDTGINNTINDALDTADQRKAEKQAANTEELAVEN